MRSGLSNSVAVLLAFAATIMPAACSPRVATLPEEREPVHEFADWSLLGQHKELVVYELGKPDRMVDVPPVKLIEAIGEWCLTPLLWQFDAVVVERWTYLLEEDHPLGPRLIVCFDEGGRVLMFARQGPWR